MEAEQTKPTIRELRGCTGTRPGHLLCQGHDLVSDHVTWHRGGSKMPSAAWAVAAVLLWEVTVSAAVQPPLVMGTGVNSGPSSKGSGWG